MSAPLLATKLYFPAPRPDLVPRPRLIEKLNNGLSRRLILISASAGFGKSTLLAAWVQQIQRRIPVTGLALDERDNDLVRFLSYFIYALQSIESEFGQEALIALQSAGPVNIEAVLTTLLNEIAALDNPVVLIFDDYHVIESPPVDEALIFILEHMPPQLHLVVASRIDPSWPLPRLRARGQMTELRADDLRFSREEAGAFLNQVMGLELTTQDVAALRARTEGWIAGLQLAALSMKGVDDVQGFVESFTGSNRFILDYLGEEVLAHQPEEVQDFLLKTSLLARLTGPLCDAVTERANGEEILKKLERENLFLIPLDNERRWYRYHHLFADLLRFRLRRKAARLIPRLHRRASEWHERNGNFSQAIDHAIGANDINQAARLVEENYRLALQRGEVSVVLAWLGSLPDEIVRADPSLSIGYGWGLFLSGQMDKIEAWLLDAESALARQAAAGGSPQADELFGEMATLRSYLLRVQGKPARGIELAEQVLAQVPDDNLSARGILYTILGGLYRDVGDIRRASQSYTEAFAICRAAGNTMAATMAVEHLVRLLVMQGQLQQAAEMCRQILDSTDWPDAPGNQQALMSDIVRASLANVLYEWNELAEAEGYLRKGIEQGKRGGFFQAVLFGQILLAKVLQARGDADGANDMLQAASNTARMSPPRWYRAALVACQVQLSLAQGNVPAASRWVQESDITLGTEFNLGDEFEYITLARVLIAQGQFETDGATLSQALRLLERLSQSAELAGRRGHLVKLLALQALALKAQGNLKSALDCLGRSLEIAEPEGYFRVFVDCGSSMAQLLSEAAARGIMAEYTSELLADFDADQLRDIRTLSQPLIEPLSRRELEVLELIAEGLTNREISERLFLALSTVKGHNRNIFDKLQVRRRTEAAARARELNLV